MVNYLENMIITSKFDETGKFCSIWTKCNLNSIIWFCCWHFVTSLASGADHQASSAIASKQSFMSKKYTLELKRQMLQDKLFLSNSEVLNMICGLSMTHSHTSKITKWSHILVIPLVGSPKPRTKRKNSPTHPGTEKREAKVVILGVFRGGLRVLIRSFQTWACGYEEI